MGRFVLALALLASAPGLLAGSNGHPLVQNLQDEWANIFYRLPVAEQAEKLNALLPTVHALVERYPREADPLVLEAFVLCSSAAADLGLGALSKVERARDLLVQSIALDPKAMGASAYVTLGNLYHRLPGWPISYGQDEQARQYLEAALNLFPESLDANYFYGDFLISQGEFGKALTYLEKADQAPVRPESRLSDLKLKEELKQELTSARKKDKGPGDFYSQLLSAFNTSYTN
jgi:tetratricopeptide (TPR) repeat protein